MNRIDRYLFLQFASAVGFSCLAVTTVVWFTQGIRMMSMVINNGGSLWSFVKLMLLILPTFLPLVLPISLAVGVMFVYHRLIAESELVVMRALGLSPLALAKPALVLAGLVAAMGYFLTLFLSPIANHEFVKLQYEIRNDLSILLLHTGGFNDVSKGLTFYARDRGQKGELRGILIHDTRKPGHPSTIMADAGELVHAPKGPSILVRHGMRQEMDETTGLLSQLSFETYMMDLSTMGDNFDERFIEPRERSMFGLLNPPTEADNAMRSRFFSEFHMRLVLPFLAITFILVVCVATLTGHFDRRGTMQRVMAAAIALTVLEAALLVTFNQTVKHIWLAPLLYLVVFVPGIFFYQRLATDPVWRPIPPQGAAT